MDDLDKALRGALTGPEMLTDKQFAKAAGLSPGALDRKRLEGRVLGLGGAQGGFRYPAWQLREAGGLVPGLHEVLRKLHGGSWMAWRFLSQAHPQLGGLTGIEALKAGRLAEVLDVARVSGQGNVS